MKDINFKNIVRGVAVGILLLSVFISYQNRVVYAQNNATPCILENTYLHAGGNSSECAPGVLDVTQFELAPYALRTFGANFSPSIVFSPSGNPGIFRLVGMSIFDSVIAYDNAAFAPTFVGYSTLPIPAPGAPELQVNGVIRIESEADASADDYEPACVTDFGKIIRCTDTNEGGIFAVNGQCGSASEGSTSSAPTTNLCSSGTASTITTTPGSKGAPTPYSWTCNGSNGGTTASCSSTQSEGK